MARVLGSCMLCPRGGDRLGRCEGGRHVENSEHSEGDGEVHDYPAGQRGRDSLGIVMLAVCGGVSGDWSGERTATVMGDTLGYLR